MARGGAPKPKYTVNISNHSSVVGACLTHKQFLTTDNLESQIRNLIQCKINDCTPERSKELHNQTDSLTHQLITAHKSQRHICAVQFSSRLIQLKKFASWLPLSMRRRSTDSQLVLGAQCAVLASAHECASVLTEFILTSSSMYTNTGINDIKEIETPLYTTCMHTSIDGKNVDLKNKKR